MNISKLVMSSATEEPKEIDLNNDIFMRGESVVLGRDRDQRKGSEWFFQLPSGQGIGTVSGRHLMIVRREDGLYLATDLGSKNNTFVKSNGSSYIFTPGEPRVLIPNTSLLLGSYCIDVL